jgi:membrane associated rhomboid family serine protease
MKRTRKRKVKRARDAAGHFVKKNPRKKRKSAHRRKPATRRKVAHRRKARRRGVVRVKRALGRKCSSGRFTRRPRHRTRGYLRKVPGRRRKRLVRSHLSYESSSPAKKKRRARRAREEETVMSENPRRRRRRRSGKARRRHHRHAAENPRKRRRRGRRRARRRASVTATVPAVVRRRRRGRGRKARGTTRSPGTIKVVIAGLGRRGGSRKRRASSRKRKHAHKRRKGHARRRRHGYTPRSHQLPMSVGEAGFFENPLGGYTLENPMSGGELAFAALTGAVGFVVGDFLDRYLAVQQYVPATTTTGQTALTPDVAVATAPRMMRILAQAALAAAPLAGAYWVHKPMAKAALQGLGLGVLFRLGGQLINQFVIQKMVVNAAAGTFLGNGQQYYQDEVHAGTAAASSHLSGAPFGLGAAPKPQQQQQPQRALGAPRVVQRPSIPYKDPGPRAVAAPPQRAGVGNCLDNPECNPCNMDSSQTPGQPANPPPPSNGSSSSSPGQPANPPPPSNGSSSSSPVLSGVPSDWFPDA